jgi:phage-related protein (TIGR01555 family)
MNDGGLWMADGLSNFASGLGGDRDKVAHWRHTYTPLSRGEIDSIYATDWLGRKIIDIPPQDMTREWRTWQAELRPAEDLYAAEKHFHLRTKVRQALTVARLHGGSAILIGDRSAARDPRKPLDLERVKQGDLQYLHVFSRWDLTEGKIIVDLEDPDFGKPEFYKLNVAVDNSTQQPEIHRSRFAFFSGVDAPKGMVSTANGCWGFPLFESIRQAIINVGAAAANAAALTEEAKIDIITIPDLSSQLATTEGTNRLIRRFGIAATLKSTMSTLVLGEQETFDRKQVSFGGLPELIATHLQMASGAADIPLTRLLGQSPAGLNATGESDIRNYYDMLGAKQKTDLEESLETLDEVLVRHVLGDAPDEVVYGWNPLWQMSPAEKADVALKKAQQTQIIVGTNLLAPEEMRGAMVDQLIADEIFPTLDQHLLSEADFEALLEEQAAAKEEEALAPAQEEPAPPV